MKKIGSSKSVEINGGLDCNGAGAAAMGIIAASLIFPALFVVGLYATSTAGIVCVTEEFGNYMRSR